MVNPGKPTREEKLRNIAANLARAFEREPLHMPEKLIQDLRRLKEHRAGKADSNEK